MLGSQSIAGCVLAGGQSRRMGGREKSMLSLAGKPMLAHVLERLGPQVELLFVNANGPPDRFSQFDVPVVADSLKGHLGPLAGIHAGLHWLRDQAPEISHMVTVSTDAPLMPRDLVARFAAPLEPSSDNISMARSAGRLHPVIALWPVSLADDLELAVRDGTRKVLRWTDTHIVHAIDFEPLYLGDGEIDPFFNANTPDELARLETILSGSLP